MTGSRLLRAWVIVGVLLTIGLGACGDSEATQRKAFIEFLQTRIIGKPGVHVPKLTEQETAAFGLYAKHYAVIADFNAGLDEAVSKPMTRALEAAPRSLDQLAAKRSEIAEIKSGMGAIRSALDRQLAAAEAARAALEQPDDLKPVYATAYDRDVMQPAKTFAEIFPDVDEAIGTILAFADYLEQNRDKVKIEGAMIRVNNPSVQARLQALIEGMRTKQQAVQKAQRACAAWLREHERLVGRIAGAIPAWIRDNGCFCLSGSCACSLWSMVPFAGTPRRPSCH